MLRRSGYCILGAAIVVQQQNSLCQSTEKTYRGYTIKQVAQTIDHSVLKPDFRYSDIEEGAAIAKQYNTASYCIRPMDVARASKILAGSGVPICTGKLPLQFFSCSSAFIIIFLP
jgi:hypothetical protein